MAIARARRRVRDDSNGWILTSLAISLVVHVLLMHYLGGVRILDVESFRSSVSRWFSIDEKLLDSAAPDISSTTTDVPPPVDPSDVINESEPIAGPDARIDKGQFTVDQGIDAPTFRPSAVRPPDTNPAIIHHQGPRVDVSQTDAYLGQEAPVGTAASQGPGPSGRGTRMVLGAPPAPPKPPPVSLGLAEVRAVRPAADTHVGALAAPAVSPHATRIELSGEPSPGIVIPIEDDAASRAPDIPKVIISEAPTWTDPAEPDKIVIPLDPDEVHVKFTMYAEPGDTHAYFRLEIAVAKRDQLPVIPKDVMFICDVSLSMRSRELRAAREAVAAYLRTLRRTDRFNVVVFSERPRKLFPDFVEPSPDRVQAAATFVDRIPGEVKTDVYRVLKAVVRDVAQQSIRNRPTNIFFVSDGRSTSGIRDARRIVNEIGAYSRPNFAIFPFDAGRGGNRYLLDLLAYRSRGIPAFCDDSGRAAQEQAALFRAYENPVLMRLRLDYTNLDVAETYPAFLPNLYADKPILIYGRCKPG
ncbi:VWA domain-containing protein, partial [Planctomycetota bacterium]